jgi:hypothetical protein
MGLLSRKPRQRAFSEKLRQERHVYSHCASELTKLR